MLQLLYLYFGVTFLEHTVYVCLCAQRSKGAHYFHRVVGLVVINTRQWCDGQWEYQVSVVRRLYFSSRPSNVRDGSVRSTKRTSLSSTRGGVQPATLSSTPAAGANGPSSRGSPRNSDNSVHPGPIFLRHVVSRPFEYRWLILATSVITCMTIIVIVSVVYSNV